MATEASPTNDDPPPLPSASPSAIYRQLSIYTFDEDPEYLAGLSAILGHPDTPPTQEELTSNPDLILQARCFYFARQNNLPPINPAGYQQWLSENNSPQKPATSAPSQVTEAAQSNQLSTSSATTSVPTSTNEQQPPYPTSFAAIVDLITRNVPVPGIEEIPDTVLEHGSSKVDHTPRRRKPWETDAENALPILPVVPNDGEAAAGTAVDSNEATSAAATQVQDVVGEDVSASTGEQQQQQKDEEESGSGADKANINGHLATGEGVVKILQEGAIPDSGLLARD